MVKLERILNMAKQPDFYNSQIFLPLPGTTQLLATAPQNWQEKRGRNAKRRPWEHDDTSTLLSDQKPRAKKRKSQDTSHWSSVNTTERGEDLSIGVTQSTQSTKAVVEKLDALYRSNNVAVGAMQKEREQENQWNRFSQVNDNRSFRDWKSTESLVGLFKDCTSDSRQDAGAVERSETTISLPSIDQYEGMAPQLTDYFTAHHLLEPHVAHPSQPWVSIPALSHTFPGYRVLSPFHHNNLHPHVSGLPQSVEQHPVPFGQQGVNEFPPLVHPVPQPQPPWDQLQRQYQSELNRHTNSSAHLLMPQQITAKNHIRKPVLSANMWRLVQPKTPGPLQMVYMAKPLANSEATPLQQPGSSPSHLFDEDSRIN